MKRFTLESIDEVIRFCDRMNMGIPSRFVLDQEEWDRVCRVLQERAPGSPRHLVHPVLWRGRVWLFPPGNPSDPYLDALLGEGPENEDNDFLRSVGIKP